MNERYRQTPQEIFDQLNSGESGLSSEQAEININLFGKNEITERKRKSIIIIFLEQFKDFLVIILIIAALVSAVMGDLESFAVIIAVITLNSVLGTVQTVKSEKSISNLKKLSSPDIKVIRNGETVIIPSEKAAVGDVVIIEAGDRIPADGRLIECASVKVNESSLTGESIDVEKKVDVIDREVPLGDRSNMVYSGSFVTYGRGKFIITDVGMSTEVGKIAALIKNAQERKTPLQITLDSFGRKLSIAIILICAVVFILSMIQGNGVMDSFIFAVALAVAAIPEALSSIVTILLSFGTQKMAKENAIIRKLQSVEGLGSVSVICSDKTGTLTQNKMTVQNISMGYQIFSAEEFKINNSQEKLLLTASVLCNDSQCSECGDIGDPTETALIHFAVKNDFDIQGLRSDFPRISEIPFDSERKLMSTLNVINGKNIIFTKGAADVLVKRLDCNDKTKAHILEQTELLSAKGLRILCFASKICHKEKININDENGLKFLGLIAMADPPREESAQAVAECRKAGIKPIMITGDHLITASAVAKEIGILTDASEAVEGSILDQFTDQQLIDFVGDKSVFARVTPEHKIRIVKAWQNRGSIVAMTGDGVNDAPALKQADVGVAMGVTGTEAAKESAAMVLADDNFATIVKAIKNGRNIFENIKKSILFLLSGNLAGIITVIFCSVLNLPVPFEAIHLLFINLLTDSLPAIALGLEPHNDKVMERKPRPSEESILTRSFLFRISYSGLIIAAVTIIAYMIGNTYSTEIARTMSFATLCMSRLFHGFNCKQETPVLFTKKMIDNKFLIAAFSIGFILLSIVLFMPDLNCLFKIAEIGFKLYGIILLLSFSSMTAIQLIKVFRKNKLN